MSNARVELMDLAEADIDALRRKLNRKLAVWCVRWGLTALLAGYFLPRYPSFRWVLYVAVPLGLLNLGMILMIRSRLSRTASQLKQLTQDSAIQDLGK